MSQLLSGKVKVVRPTDVSEDRYEYLRLNEAEPNLGVPESGSLSSGSIALVASDADGNRLFVTTLQLDQVTGSFSGSFAGDGSELNNLPDVQQLRSGSVSASIAPNTGFLVNVSASIDGDLDLDGTARITGDLIVDNRIVARELIVEIISSSILFSTGSNIFGDELTDKQEFTGSVEMTGSLTVDGDTNITGAFGVIGNVDVEGSSSLDGDVTIIGTTTLSGSTFVSGNVQLNSGSAFSGSGENLFNIPKSALTEDALLSNLITTGSVTASVSKDGFFRVFSTGSVTSEFSGSIFVSGNIELNSGSAFSGSGENLFNIPKSALTDDALLSNLITTGSVTASVSQDGFFRVFSTGSVTTELSGSLLVSGNVNLNSGSSFSGSGENLFNIPRSALTEDALETNLIISGAVTASVDPQDGFVVTSIDSGSTFSGSIFLSSGSVFSGSGRDLFDIPLSALAETSPLIAEGNVTASTEGDVFTVTSVDSGSIFSGSIRLSSGSVFSGSGEDLFNIPRSALTEDALLSTFIRSGSVTASVDPNEGFVVTSIDSGSTFSGSIFLSSGSFFSGSGENLFNIPRTALVDDALLSNLIVTGSVTASVATDGFFRVQGTGSVTTELSGSVFVSGNIQLNSGSAFSGSGRDLFDVPLAALSDDAQEAINAAASIQAGILASGSVTASVTDNIFRVISTDSGSVFSGSIFLSSGSFFSGSGENLFDIPRSALVDDALLSNLITTGSVTASVSPDGVFKVFASESVKSEFSGSVFVSESLEAKKITADEFTGSFSGSFAGDGSQLNNIPQSALSEDASRIASGSATASISPNLGFVVNTSSSIEGDLSVSGRITAEEIFVNFISSSIIYSSGSNIFGDDSGSDTQKLFGETQIFGNVTASGQISSSGFVGDGSELFNIPQSALSDNSPLIASGAVTASTENDIFTVISTNSGSIFSGSIEVSGSVQLSSGFAFSGSGENLFNIPQSALSEDATRIASGSATASISPNLGFVVNTSSSFDGIVNVTENGFFSGSGEGLFDIPLSAITEEAFRIVSGSVTASVDPAYGFRVNDGAQFSGSLIASSSQNPIPTGSLNTIFNVNGSEGPNNYVFSGAVTGSDPSLTLVKNVTYTFNIDADGHPFYIKGQGDTDTNNVLTGSQFEGFNGTDSGSFTFTPTGSDTIIYYNCSVHASMGNSISLVDFIYEDEVPHTFIGSVNVDGNQTITGSLTTTGNIDTNIVRGTEFSGSFSGSGENLFDIPLSALAEDVVQRTFIASGSVTASVSPVDGFVVNTSSSFQGDIDIIGDTAITGGLIVSNSVVELQNIPVTQSVTVSGSQFIINGNAKPELKFVRENSYYFDLSDSTNTNNTLRLSTFNDGVHNAGTEYTSFVTSGSAEVGNSGAYLQIIVTGSTPQTLYYYSEETSSYGNKINVFDTTPIVAQNILEGNTEITGNLDVTQTITANKIEADEFSGSFSGSFVGDGSQLTNVQADLSPIIASGSATASVESGESFVVTAISGSEFISDVDISGSTFIGYNTSSINLKVTGSVSVQDSVTASFFVGDGRFLENVEAAAAPLIASGSATASVASGDTFIVTAPDSGSIFTGSIITSGSITVGGGGRFVGDGSGLTDISIANLALTLNVLESGSATASLDETEFKVFSNNVSTSVDSSFSGSMNISESLTVGGVITGDGSGITNIDIANLAIDSSRIFTGSVTASVDPMDSLE